MIDIRDDSGHLLMRYNPGRDMIEIQRRGIKMNIDLKQYKESAMSDNYTRILHAIELYVVPANCNASNLSVDEIYEMIKALGNILTTEQRKTIMSATSAATQGGANGRQFNR